MVINRFIERLKDIFQKAKYPERIFVGICQQNHEKDKDCSIINYCIMAIIQMEYDSDNIEIGIDKLQKLYDKYSEEIMNLLSDKNHDYDEAWKEMRISSMTDIILMKLYRTKQIENNNGKTLISEGIKANYQDIVNYSVFCLIKLLIYKK